MTAQSLILTTGSVAVILWTLALIPEPVTPERELEYYCEMHQIYLESDGAYGWPDFNGQAHLCPEVRDGHS